MNKNNAHKYLPLVQALADGKTIQGSTNPEVHGWADYADNENVNFSAAAGFFRIKPEPTEIWYMKNSDGHLIAIFCRSKNECQKWIDKMADDDDSWEDYKPVLFREVTDE